VLPVTGANGSNGLIAVTVALLTIGAAAMWAARRRT
jgi:LPXTG-motif cell wall-anchored protein